MRVIGALVLSFLVCCLLSLSPARAQIDVDVSVDVAPPPLPVYDQPAIPAPGYIWTPGYWAWDDVTGYYWVPGTWVQPPEPELLWTPGYWGWEGGNYLFHSGYWGPQIGFYGGVPYGFGYTGNGYEGGYWRGGGFFYNRSVNNIGGVAISNVYNKTVEMRNTTNVSYNGGAGGIEARATPEQLAAANGHHVGATAEQTQHMQAAARDPALSLNNNHGHPTIAATGHPGQLSGAGVVAAHPGTPVAAIAPQGHHVGGPAAPGGAKLTPSAGTVPGNHALPGVQPGAPGTKVGTGNAATAPGNHALPGAQPGAADTKVGTGNAATAPGNHVLPGVAPAHGNGPAGGSPVANTHPGTEMHEMHNGAGPGTPPPPHVGGAPATAVHTPTAAVHTPTAAVHTQPPAPSVARPTPAVPAVHAVKPPTPPPARVAAPAPHPAPPPHPAPKPAPPPKPKCQPGQHC
jgi:hypothetical protein